MKRLLTAGLVLSATAAFAAPGGVTGSKHDFSQGSASVVGAASGPGSRCFFCHASHGGAGGSVKLSNRPDAPSRAQGYQSSTMAAAPEPIAGASKTCLSCHDGTVAPGKTRAGTAATAATAAAAAPLAAKSPSNLGTDLRGSHPVSLRTPLSTRVVAPSPSDAVKLDDGGRVQCTSCHDPHVEWGDPVVGKFLVKPSGRSALCTTCHAQGGLGAATASHATAAFAFRDPASGRSTTLAEAGCAACHVSHGADPRTRLLRAAATDDGPCLECHAAGTRRPLGLDLGKPWAHPSSPRGRHDAGEGPRAAASLRLPESSPGAARHAACVDCHDPHAATSAPAMAPLVGGALAGVWGIGLDGEPVRPALFEYQVCLKCHGDSANKPQARPGAILAVRRASPDANLRLVFGPGAASFHPVAAPSKNGQVPGLKPPLGGGSLILCSDCHASDTGAGAGGAGPRGPHGSSFPALLERRYLTADLTPESPEAYALCYKCHDRDVLLSDRSGFPPHRKHVVEKSAPCSACHDAHGVSADAGNERSNAHLIAFDTAIVQPATSGLLEYQAGGPRHGSCSLTCHQVAHGPSSPNGKAFSY
jgi:predicted CXXCH cytochrome family protein